MTTIEDTITYFDGTVASGRIVLTWPPFAYAGTAVAAGQQAFEIALDGSISITCYPCVGALPAGTYYTATYQLDKGPVYDEFWVVPSSGPTNIASIRVS